MQKLNVFYEDKDIIVCEKPQGVPSQSDKTNDIDMTGIIKNYLFSANKKPNPYVGIVHRLDRPVGGIMVYAKSEKALKNLNVQIRNSEISKYYLAVGEVTDGDYKPDDNYKILCDYIIKDGKGNTSRICDNIPGSKLAKLEYRIIDSLKEEKLILMEIKLHTGRHHQIRVQMANEGLPLWGDSKYNKDFTKRHSELRWFNIALYAYKLEFNHPVTNEHMIFTNKPVNYMCFNRFYK
ncbi:MAG: RluA family pseudouridine synthase [Lachnospiraceae bacterium]|nr:RluA family pseudouridine synthase [Lachnospiraceae bacterium]